MKTSELYIRTTRGRGDRNSMILPYLSVSVAYRVARRKKKNQLLQNVYKSNYHSFRNFFYDVYIFYLSGVFFGGGGGCGGPLDLYTPADYWLF